SFGACCASTASGWTRVQRWKSSPGRRCGRPRLPVVRPRIEELESRLVPTVSVVLQGGQLIVSGAADSANHTITLDHTGPSDGSGRTIVNADGNLGSFRDSNITAGIVINDGNGSGTINIRATLKPTSVEGLAGNDTVTVGKGGNMQAIVAPLSITHSGATGGIALTLDDSTDPFFRDVTMGI